MSSFYMRETKAVDIDVVKVRSLGSSQVLNVKLIFFSSLTFIPLLNLFLLELGGNMHRNNALENQVVSVNFLGYLAKLNTQKFKLT